MFESMGGEPFQIYVPEEVLEDLRARLVRTHWPEEATEANWDRGASPAYMRELVGYWINGFDWRAQEEHLNRFSHFRAQIGALGVHFVHERGKGPNPLPLVLTHGWPSTFFEMLKMVPLLTDPASHGADAADSFDVVVPSLPGYGFSDPLPPGESARIPEMWARLVTEVLGYERFAAHGGDIGGMVTNRLGVEFPERLVGIHVTFTAEPYVGTGAPELSERERVFLEERARAQEVGTAYAHLQRTRPQTPSYALNDSPVGLAAWIVEKWREWSDCGGDVERRFTKDELLTTVTLYWVTGTIGSSFGVYRDWALGSASQPLAWEGREEVPPGVDSKPLNRGQRIEVPAAVAVFNERWPKEWVERAYADLRRFTEMPRGGHFAAMEEPELLAEDIRSFFRPLRWEPYADPGG